MTRVSAAEEDAYCPLPKKFFIRLSRHWLVKISFPLIERLVVLKYASWSYAR